MARPRKTVDESRIIELASKGHTLKGIAAMCGISYATLHRRFATACEKGEELCNDALRVRQIERALAGSDTMLIWLGKQRLGQRDKQELTGSDGGPLQVFPWDQVLEARKQRHGQSDERKD
jgi:lambda repressor-like predicted transcriptional regulator